MADQDAALELSVLEAHERGDHPEMRGCVKKRRRRPSIACKLKRRFPTYEAAVKALPLGELLQVYWCRACRRWHLTSRFLLRRRP